MTIERLSSTFAEVNDSSMTSVTLRLRCLSSPRIQPWVLWARLLGQTIPVTMVSKGLSRRRVRSSLSLLLRTSKTAMCLLQLDHQIVKKKARFFRISLLRLARRQAQNLTRTSFTRWKSLSWSANSYLEYSPTQLRSAHLHSLQLLALLHRSKSQVRQMSLSQPLQVTSRLEMPRIRAKLHLWSKDLTLSQILSK